jgi:16S rRNA (guanine(527)-N(7))-methyltransferase RsmG
MQSEQINWFYELCIKNGLKPTTDKIEQLGRYVDLLLEWNKRINLVSRKDEEKIWTYHILHSITLLFKVEIAQNSNIVDIGTGGGLPGIPIKIMRPDISMLCIDSTGKKIKALSHMVNDLNLNGIKTVWGRAEEIGLQSEYKGKFDFAFARAVAPLSDLVLWAKNFLKGKLLTKQKEKQYIGVYIDPDPPVLLAFKGGDISKEIEIVKKKHPELDIKSVDLVFPGTEEFISSDKKLLIVHL